MTTILVDGQPLILPPGTKPKQCGLCGSMTAYLTWAPPMVMWGYMNPIPFGSCCVGRLRKIFPSWEE